MFKSVDPKKKLPEMEEEILKFWEEKKIFEKSITSRDGAPQYSFYDGPPFATGTPHYGHIVASAMKDAVPRYWTMRGFQVERKWGWDCHGLPIENIVEKEMGSRSKKDIEAIGVEKFNALCRDKVLEYVADWKVVIRRLGRFADMENAYKTMDLPFMESVWWVFKELYEKGLIYEGYRSMHICPRCETTLSQSEVAEGYKDIKDLSVIAKFELVDEPGTYVLAWTTTPWTLIGNVALAVNPSIKYQVVGLPAGEAGIEQGKDTYIIAENRVGEIFKDKEYKVISEIDGKDLVGKSYKPLFDYYFKDQNLKNHENAASATHSRSEGGRGWKIYAGDFVTTEEGTGVVHIAPAFGEDDMNFGKEYDLPFVQHVGMDGVIKDEAGEFAGMNVKPRGADGEKDPHQKTDVEIIKYLAKNNFLFSKEKYEHSYPHCWRCDTPLLNYATSSWFVSVEKIKDDMLQYAREINWFPAHMKIGRFGNWLFGARDWSISRQRFWASVIPIWRCEKCKATKVLGSVKELEELSGEKVTDLHKDVVDKITFQCDECEATMRRVPDVLDTWFDSGSMPYAQMHYPFENQEKFEKSFPAQFIAEGVDQTRAWFYYLHVIASGIKKQKAFENVIVNGIVLAEDGKKMAKKLKNYPDPMLMLDKYGADAMRLYLLGSPVLQAENLNFKEADMADITRGALRMLWNSYSFFALYANIDKYHVESSKYKAGDGKNLLDRWIMSELQVVVRNVNEAMEGYNIPKAIRNFSPFIDHLSNWYIRRSRKRFWKSENDTDKNEAYATLHHVLVELSKLMAPFAPFVSEEIYRNLASSVETQNFASVHLENYPQADEKLIDEKLNKNMNDLREIITLGLQDRAKNKIKVRQPLKRVVLGQKYSQVFNEMISKTEWSVILLEELNVKGASLGTETETVMIDAEITPELKLEGVAREIIRHIQEMRKEAGYEVDNRIKVWYLGQSEVFREFGQLIAKETLADDLAEGKPENADLEKEFSIDGEIVSLSVKK